MAQVEGGRDIVNDFAKIVREVSDLAAMEAWKEWSKKLNKIFWCRHNQGTKTEKCNKYFQNKLASIVYYKRCAECEVILEERWERIEGIDPRF